MRPILLPLLLIFSLCVSRGFCGLTVSKELSAGQYKKIMEDPARANTAEWAWARYFLIADKAAYDVALKSRDTDKNLLASFIVLKCLREGVGVKRNESRENALNFEIRTALEKVTTPTAVEHFMLASLSSGDKDGVISTDTPDDNLKVVLQHRKSRWEHLNASADAGFAEAINDIGFINQQDDEAGALERYEKAAKSGLASAMKNLGYLLAVGQNTEHDHDRARKVTLEAAEAGDIFAMVNVAAFRERAGLKNISEEEAKKAIEQAVNHGHPLGKMEKGLALMMGHYGFKKDRKAGLALFQKAAETGHSFALGQIAYFYYQGLGFGKNLDKATEFGEAAWTQGNSSSAGLLARIYKDREAGNKDLETKAKYWLTQSQEGGLAYALRIDQANPEIVKALAEIDPFALKIE